ncbi:hypothetical protein ACFV6D_00950 [Kitasatospora sp. NPDC059812]|uniref:hypothetical protein n=1 Tax=Kitasatospora sp. NPDC059812 TaxID=3346958 RepID=UPI003652C7DA
MTTTRLHWADLPGSVHRAVTARLGTPVLAAQTVSAGFNSKIAAKLSTARGAVFAFAQAQARMWAEIAGDDPDPWTAGLNRAAQQWARFRGRS